MSIEETYSGQWSSDPALLKTLLDAGNTIMAKSQADGMVVELSIEGPFIVAVSSNITMPAFSLNGWSFLVPSPRPMVEPKPLEWVQPYESHKIAADGKYTYRIWDHGVAEYSENKGKSWRPIQKCESKYWGFMEAEKAVYDWRMAIIKSMTE